MTSKKPICFDCKHINFNLLKLKCPAFPEGIPEEILLGENDHSEPLPEQNNDIVFQELTDFDKGTK